MKLEREQCKQMTQTETPTTNHICDSYTYYQYQRGKYHVFLFSLHMMAMLRKNNLPRLSLSSRPSLPQRNQNSTHAHGPFAFVYTMKLCLTLVIYSTNNTSTQVSVIEKQVFILYSVSNKSNIYRKRCLVRASNMI